MPDPVAPDSATDPALVEHLADGDDVPVEEVHPDQTSAPPRGTYTA